MDTTLQEQILNRIFQIELYSRLGLSLFFGLSIIGFALTLQKIDKKNFMIYFLISRILFLFGTLSLLVYCILQFIIPITSLTNEFYNIFSFIFGILLFTLNQEKRETPALYFIIGSIIFLLTTLISFLEPKILLQTEQNYGIFLIHILCSIVSTGLFIISFSASILFILKHNNLKHKKIESKLNSTSLYSLEKVMMNSSFLGLGVITIALITGLDLIFINKHLQEIGFFKIFWSFFVWGWFATTIVGRLYFGWKGSKSAWLLVTGTLFLLFGLTANLFSTSQNKTEIKFNKLKEDFTKNSIPHFKEDNFFSKIDTYVFKPSHNESKK